MIDIRENTIVRVGDDADTPWLVIHISEPENDREAIPPSRTKVWVRKVDRRGKTFVAAGDWDNIDRIVERNQIWIA